MKEDFLKREQLLLNVHEMAFRYVPYLLVRGKMGYFVLLGFVELKFESKFILFSSCFVFSSSYAIRSNCMCVNIYIHIFCES